MRALAFLLLLVALAYAQLCATYAGSFLPKGVYYVEWREPTVLYANGSVVVYLPGEGNGVIWASGPANSSSPVRAISCVGLELLAARLKPADTPWGPAAPLGLAYYGLGFYNGVLLPLPYEGEAVKGCFELKGFSAVSRSPLGDAAAYSIQLNAYVEASGLYWVQALIRYREGAFEFLDNVWNMTTSVSALRGIEGRGYVGRLGPDEYYYYLTQMPRLQSACLEIRVDGNVVEFLVNGELLDEVRLPSPGRIVVLPQVNARGLPIDLELVVGGYGADMYMAEALNGSVLLSLYVWNGTAFSRPPALWSLGLSTKESIVASVSSADGSALVSPGVPEARQLYLEPPCIYFLNGTADCGGLKYLVELELPNGTSYLWAPPGRLSIELPEIRSADVVYEPTAPADLYVRGPARVKPSYKAFYLLFIRTATGVEKVWAAQGTFITASNFTFVKDGVIYAGDRLVFDNGSAELLVVEEPGNASVLYVAVYNGTARDLLGVPSPLSVAVLQCDDRTAYALAGPLGRYNASIADIAGLCSARVYSPPISLYVLIPVLLILSKLLRRRKI